jgi:hypothetical protein
MDNLVVLHPRHALDLLMVLLGLLRLLRDQLLQMLDHMLQLCRLSLTHLELLISLVQLGLKVMDIALGSGQLILSILQLGAGTLWQFISARGPALLAWPEDKYGPGDRRDTVHPARDHGVSGPHGCTAPGGSPVDEVGQGKRHGHRCGGVAPGMTRSAETHYGALSLVRQGRALGW